LSLIFFPPGSYPDAKTNADAATRDASAIASASEHELPPRRLIRSRKIFDPSQESSSVLQPSSSDGDTSDEQEQVRGKSEF